MSEEELVTAYIGHAMKGLTVAEIAKEMNMEVSKLQNKLTALRQRKVNVPTAKDIRKRKDSELNALIKKLTK